MFRDIHYKRSHLLRGEKRLYWARLALALLSTLASIALAWGLLVGSHTPAHASSPTIRETAIPNTDPWGEAFDKSGNIWVAESICDPTPTCGPQSGSIAEFDRTTFSLIQDYTEPWNYSSPLFLAADANGNIWFTEPSSNAIGELVPNNGNPTWSQYPLPTNNAIPYDLTFDWSGNLWFTEYNNSSIGELIPSSGQIVETPTPTPNSTPYGIIGPDPTTGSIWFTENNSAVSRIGRFTPPLSGSLTAGNISEYLTKSRTFNTTPHLLTFDYQGDIWWTEGFVGNIGKLVINQAANETSNGVTEYAVPPPSCSPGTNCGMHISGISVDSNNTVWFDDSLSARLGSFVPSTNTFSMIVLPGGTGSDKHPHDGLAVDSENNVWFTEEFSDNLGEVVQPNQATPTPGVTTTPGTPQTSTAPVNTNWYFGEGRVGSGFQEFLTFDNPDSTQNCAVDVRYMYSISGGPSNTKTIVATVGPASRETQSVNNDLGISSLQTPAANVSSFVTIDSSTPNCPGVVVERPLYYHFGSSPTYQSGSDVIGATHTASNFYFADIPTGGGYSSFLTILNPGTSDANVTATYYANGQKVNSQSLLVPAGTRGTMSPNSLKLPQHVSDIISSTQPITIERPDYFAQVNGGNAGTVSGGTCVVGAQSLANDWLFAEGTTRTHFQENFVIANLDTSANHTAVVTITLEYSGGGHQSYMLNVNALSQVIWNVNQYAQGKDVSAEISSNGAKIIAQREMFFQYTVGGINATAIGGTDVIGQVGPAAQSAYSFAEGYIGRGFNEWLTLQNPTNNEEHIYLTLINGAGQTYTQWFQVAPQSRTTANITALAGQYLTQNANISMLVQSQSNTPFVAERPMYWNQGGTLSTEGGSDVIGYSGQ